MEVLGWAVFLATGNSPRGFGLKLVVGSSGNDIRSVGTQVVGLERSIQAFLRALRGSSHRGSETPKIAKLFSLELRGQALDGVLFIPMNGMLFSTQTWCGGRIGIGIQRRSFNRKLLK